MIPQQSSAMRGADAALLSDYEAFLAHAWPASKWLRNPLRRTACTWVQSTSFRNCSAAAPSPSVKIICNSCCSCSSSTTDILDTVLLPERVIHAAPCHAPFCCPLDAPELPGKDRARLVVIYPAGGLDQQVEGVDADPVHQDAWRRRADHAAVVSAWPSGDSRSISREGDVGRLQVSQQSFGCGGSPRAGNIDDLAVWPS